VIKKRSSENGVNEIMEDKVKKIAKSLGYKG